MKEYIGLGIVVFSLIFAVSAAIMAWRLKRRLDAANSQVALEKTRREERKRTYQEVLAYFDRAISSVSKGDYQTFSNLFDELSPKLHLHASEEVNSGFVEVCLLLENWTAMRDDVAKLEKQLQQHPEKDAVLEPELEEHKKQSTDAYLLFKHKFNKLGVLMRKEISQVL